MSAEAEVQTEAGGAGAAPPAAEAGAGEGEGSGEATLLLRAVRQDDKVRISLGVQHPERPNEAWISVGGLIDFDTAREWARLIERAAGDGMQRTYSPPKPAAKTIRA